MEAEQRENDGWSHVYGNPMMTSDEEEPGKREWQQGKRKTKE